MSAEHVIAARLAASMDLRDLVDARVYAGRAPQNAPAPFVVWKRVSAVQDSALDGVAAMQTGRFQFDCFARVYDDALQLAQTVNAALTDAQDGALFAVKIGEIDIFDDVEPALWRRVVDFRTKETI